MTTISGNELVAETLKRIGIDTDQRRHRFCRARRHHPVHEDRDIDSNKACDSQALLLKAEGAGEY